MQTEWDYTSLADSYLLRPDYSPEVVTAILNISNLSPGDPVADIGAGVAHLTLMLAAQGLSVTAIEPNDAMRTNGQRRTQDVENVTWAEGTGEESGQDSSAFAMVSFGSSFNVCNRAAALEECARILRPRGWFCALWNHRDLTDPVQVEIEAIIRARIPNYDYGARREDQRTVIEESGFFESPLNIIGMISHEVSIEACVEAWRSHATLQRQAGGDFLKIISEIELYLKSLGVHEILVPYATNAWVAQLQE